MNMACKTIRQDEVTAHGRIYDRAAMEKICQLTNDQAAANLCFVVADPSDPWKIKLFDVVGRISSCSIDNGMLYCEVLPLIPHHTSGLESRDISPILFGDLEDGMVNAETLQLTGWEIF